MVAQAGRMMHRDVRKHFQRPVSGPAAKGQALVQRVVAHNEVVGILTAETRGARDRRLAVLVVWEPDHDLRVVVEAVVDVNLHG